MYTIYFDGSPDYKNRVTRKLHYRKMGLTKNIIQGMLNILKILSLEII